MWTTAKAVTLISTGDWDWGSSKSLAAVHHPIFLLQGLLSIMMKMVIHDVLIHFSTAFSTDIRIFMIVVYIVKIFWWWQLKGHLGPSLLWHPPLSPETLAWPSHLLYSGFPWLIGWWLAGSRWTEILVINLQKKLLHSFLKPQPEVFTHCIL